GQLRLLWLEAEGKPLAAEYQLAGAGTLYVYQAGLDPDRLDWEPGHLATARVLQRAIAEGCRRVDFLRGNEPYKAQWRAEFHENASVRVVAPRAGARVRHHAWLAVRTAKDWARRLKAPHS
ncbi:MAG: GNAT family N-acetyltransferase, partial [Patescibacteria group bacterium]|nr:GNAT family N-acetyltransferase [Patescibacteria group bacterium]